MSPEAARDENKQEHGGLRNKKMGPEKNAEGGWQGAKWQTIVFQKQTRVGTQEFHSRYLHPYVAPLSFLLSLCSSDLTSSPTHGDPSQHSQNSGVKFHQAHSFLLPQAAEKGC